MKRNGTLVAALLAAAACAEPMAPDRAAVEPAAPSCDAGMPVVPRVGAAAAHGAAGVAAICVSGGSEGAEYALVYSHAVANAGQQAGLVVTAAGVEAPLFALQSLTGGPALAAAAAAVMEPRWDGGFHDRLRRLERTELTLPAGVPPTDAAQRALTDAAQAQPTIGDLIPLNVQSKQSCTGADVRTGRVVAISARAVVVADTANPAAAFGAADWAALAADFDTLVAPVVTTNFGAATDVDRNGRILLFYTRAVNELTPRAADYVIGGFVFGRDLYPKQAANGVSGCAGSNQAELFYLLAPDPGGTVNGNARTLEYVRRTTVATLAHEFQHLINAGRRIHVTRASSFEASWLDEGLSHIAEELVYHRSAGLAPMQNLGSQQIAATQRRVDAYNRFQTANTGRFENFLREPSTSTPFAAGEALTTRGAIWNLLRYAADHRGGDQSDVWRRLTAGPAAGAANLAAIFGSDLGSLLADWHLSLVADDAVAGLHPAHTAPSWNMRSVYALHGRQSYPLRVATLTGAAPATATLAGGGAAFYRFRVPPGGLARIEARAPTGVLAAGVVAKVVRTR